MLGIVGLISLNIQKRTREIGIRKVLGASASHISYLFLKEFLPVILVSGLVSIPVAVYIMRGWLDDYAYRISLTAQPFLISITVLGLLTIFLIIIQTTKTVLENPVKSLRTE
jgi:ABC-type antimicrobial peptide transport system permease subunit